MRHRWLFVLASLLALGSSASFADIVNGDFSTLDLTGWTAPYGNVSAATGAAVLQEGDTLIITELQQTFGMAPPGATHLIFSYELNVTPTGPGGGIPDAFSVYLLDPVTLLPLANTPGFDDFYYHDSAGTIQYDPSIVARAGNAVLLERPFPTTMLLSFVLIGGDDGNATTVTIDNVGWINLGPRPVPLPSAAWTTLAGLAGLALLRGRTLRRR